MGKKFDLEERTLVIASNIREFLKVLKRTLTNVEYSKQLVRSGSSVGANYIEANEALSKKDYLMRVKICRKEAKETVYWLKLIECEGQETLKLELINESTELMKIFGSIIQKCK